MKNVLKFIRQDWLGILVTLTPIILLAIVWKQIPEMLPVHWNLRGEVDGTMSKTGFMWFVLGLQLGLYLLLVILPLIDPKKTARLNIRTLGKYRILLMLLLGLLHSLIIVNAMGIPVSMDKVAGIVVASIILVTGNFMSKFRPNYFVGIRTPWTLSDPEVWQRVHRFAGKLWVISGALMLLLTFLVATPFFLLFIIGVTLTISLVPIGYSYWLYQHLGHHQS